MTEDSVTCDGSKRYGCDVRLSRSQLTYRNGEYFCPRCLKLYTSGRSFAEVMQDEDQHIRKEDDEDFNTALLQTLQHAATEVDQKYKKN